MEQLGSRTEGTETMTDETSIPTDRPEELRIIVGVDGSPCSLRVRPTLRTKLP